MGGYLQISPPSSSYGKERKGKVKGFGKGFSITIVSEGKKKGVKRDWSQKRGGNNLIILLPARNRVRGGRKDSYISRGRRESDLFPLY